MDVAGYDDIDVVGESAYRDIHEELYGQAIGKQRCRVALAREPNNPYDTNAIAVMVVETDGSARRTIGYVPREDAAEIAPSLDAAGGVAVCNARLLRNDPGHVWSVTLEVNLDALSA